jgi:hypothetical protein
MADQLEQPYEDLKTGTNFVDFNTIILLALSENLKERRVYGKLLAQVRSSLYESIASGIPESLEESEETRLLNELVREYLTWQGYSHTLSTFQAGDSG